MIDHLHQSIIFGLAAAPARPVEVVTRLSLYLLAIPLGLTIIGAVLDVKNREIPNWIPLAIFCWAILATAMHRNGAPWDGLTWESFGIGLAIGAAAGGLFLVCKFGGGDAKLLAALGAALGWKGILVALVIMALVGGVMSLIAKSRGRRDVAYGPAIAGGVGGYALLWSLTVVLVALRPHSHYRAKAPTTASATEPATEPTTEPVAEPAAVP